MRVWDIHPGYLSRESLLGQHVEIHALVSIITNNKKGYRNHPETRRWLDNLPVLIRRHDITVKEMLLRGYRHKSPCAVPELNDHAHYFTVSDNNKNIEYVDFPEMQIELLKNKYTERARQGRIPLPDRETEFWAHHKYSVMARGYNHYKDMQKFLRNRKDRFISSAIVNEEGGDDGNKSSLVRMIPELMELPLIEKALRNTVDHLWGYFKNDADEEEKAIYKKACPADYPLLLDYFYKLAVKYDKKYLIYSTIFADVHGDHIC